MYDKVRLLPSAISVAFLVIPSLFGNVLYAQQSNLIVPEIKEISWGLYVDDPINACWLMSTPIPDRSKHIRDGAPRRVNRGAENEKFPTAMLVGLDRSKETVKPFITFTGGSYKFSLEEKHKTEFRLTVDGQKDFPMFPTIDPDGTYGARGWSYTYADQDLGAIEALRAGKEAKIVSVSSRGTVSTDYFSLIGFTAALEDMLKRCTLNQLVNALGKWFENDVEMTAHSLRHMLIDRIRASGYPLEFEIKLADGRRLEPLDRSTGKGMSWMLSEISQTLSALNSIPLVNNTTGIGMTAVVAQCH